MSGWRLTYADSGHQVGKVPWSWFRKGILAISLRHEQVVASGNVIGFNPPDAPFCTAASTFPAGMLGQMEYSA